jgi:hypothetical protein
MSDIRPLHHIATHSGNASDVAGGVLQRNNNGDSKLAQSSIDVYYYGCVFDTGYEEYYYWSSAEDVIVTEMWVEYVPA